MRTRPRSSISPSYTRSYPLVAQRGRGALVEDVDGNTFLDFAAGIAVVPTGHCHPEVVAAIQKQAAELIHMSGTDFYYPSLVELAQKLSAIAPGPGRSASTSATPAPKPSRRPSSWRAITRAAKNSSRSTAAFHGRTMGALSLTASKAGAAQGIRCRCFPAFFTCRIRIPIAARIGRDSGSPAARTAHRFIERELFQAGRRSARCGRHCRRADSGRRRLFARARRVSCASCRNYAGSTEFFSLRRSAVRHGPHGEMVGRRSRRA